MESCYDDLGCEGGFWKGKGHPCTCEQWYIQRENIYASILTKLYINVHYMH